MTTRIRITALTLASLAGFAGTGAAQSVHIQGSAALRARARIGGDSATAVARRAVPGGVVRSAELEREGGRLIYSFDIAVAGRPGIEEVHVDAATGALLSHEHETPAAERTEARAEAREKAAARKTVRP